MPEKYKLQLERGARRHLDRTAEPYRSRIETAIDALLEEPRPNGVVKLAGRLTEYRIRVGEYRVIYFVFDTERLVKVTDVMRRRSGTYRGFML